ncbi:MAG: hypothetical protein HYR57_01495, partial [Candidatus Koribacter versatilis]|nr:hypothetical protein [Candidatus Koribacter versatilis]
MSTQATARPFLVSTASGRDAHHTRMVILILLASALLLSIAVYGLDYYALNTMDRPYSLKHKLLKPSGS